MSSYEPCHDFFLQKTLKNFQDIVRLLKSRVKMIIVYNINRATDFWTNNSSKLWWVPRDTKLQSDPISRNNRQTTTAK